MKTKIFFFLLAASVIVFVACEQPPVTNNGAGNSTATTTTQTSGPTSTGKTIASAKSGDITVTFTNPQGYLKDGDNDFTVEFRNAAGQPVDVGASTIFIDMPAMGSMAYMKSNVKLLTTNTPGIYQATTNLEMGGTWTAHVAYKGSAGEGKMEFSINAK